MEIIPLPKQIENFNNSKTYNKTYPVEFMHLSEYNKCKRGRDYSKIKFNLLIIDSHQIEFMEQLGYVKCLKTQATHVLRVLNPHKVKAFYLKSK